MEDEFNKILQYGGGNCYISNGNGCFLNCNNYICRKSLNKESFEFKQSYKRRKNVMTRCRIPKFCERYKVDIGINDLKSKINLPRSVKQRDICLNIHKKPFCLF